jgi:hypothetical protein
MTAAVPAVATLIDASPRTLVLQATGLTKVYGSGNTAERVRQVNAPHDDRPDP